MYITSMHISYLCDLNQHAVYSWGRGEDGQLGLGDTNDQDKPVLVEALKSKGVVQVACGSGHTVVLSGECCFFPAAGAILGRRRK